MAHFAPAIFVLEKRPRWEAALKRGLADESVLVRPCRSSTDLLTLCRSAPGSIAVIDLAIGVPAVLQVLERALRDRLDFTPVVLATAEPGDLEWPLRELGARVVLPESTRGDSLVALCRRLRGPLPTMNAETRL